MRHVRWGDEHVQKSSVVNITHVEHADEDSVVMKFWHLVLLVGIAAGELGLLVAMVLAR